MKRKRDLFKQQPILGAHAAWESPSTVDLFVWGGDNVAATTPEDNVPTVVNDLP